MLLRKAKPCELDTIYIMGFDAWGIGTSLEDYLHQCRASSKYQSGTWYVLIEKDQLIASFIVYYSGFALQEGCVGIGSVATQPSQREKGYGAKLIQLLALELLKTHHTLFLHSDIHPAYYQRLGFRPFRKSVSCMYMTHLQSDNRLTQPNYF